MVVGWGGMSGTTLHVPKNQTRSSCFYTIFSIKCSEILTIFQMVKKGFHFALRFVGAKMKKAFFCSHLDNKTLERRETSIRFIDSFFALRKVNELQASLCTSSTSHRPGLEFSRATRGDRPGHMALDCKDLWPRYSAVSLFANFKGTEHQVSLETNSLASC